MVTKVIDRSVIITRYKGIDFKYHTMLDCASAMKLAKRVSQAEDINYDKYWIPLDPSKIIMMKLDPNKDLVEYNPTFKSFDPEHVKRFVSRGKTKFHARRAFWRRHRLAIVCVAGTLVNAQYSGLSGDELSNLYNAMESYNALIKKDVQSGAYAIGCKFMTFSEIMAA